jgi:hypothetical protein
MPLSVSVSLTTMLLPTRFFADAEVHRLARLDPFQVAPRPRLVIEVELRQRRPYLHPGPHRHICSRPGDAGQLFFEVAGVGATPRWVVQGGVDIMENVELADACVTTTGAEFCEHPIGDIVVRQIGDFC